METWSQPRRGAKQQVPAVNQLLRGGTEQQELPMLTAGQQELQQGRRPQPPPDKDLALDEQGKTVQLTPQGMRRALLDLGACALRCAELRLAVVPFLFSRVGAPARLPLLAAAAAAHLSLPSPARALHVSYCCR